MKQKFLSIIALVSVISLWGMEPEEKKAREVQARQAINAALSRAKNAGLTANFDQAHIDKACENAVVAAMFYKEPRKNEEYDEYLRIALIVKTTHLECGPEPMAADQETAEKTQE
jgi:hypothetical protein